MVQITEARGLGGGVGGGFTLGPPQNVFTGADRAAAESARDVYFTANPSNLATYNGDTNLNIRLEFTENSNAVALYQVRNSAGDAWLDNSSSIGIPGTPGQDGMGLPVTNVPADRVPLMNAARTEFIDSGIRLLGDGNLLLPQDVGVEADSLRIGDISTLHEANSFLRLSNAQFPDVRFDLIDARSRPDAASNRPRQFFLTEAQNDFVLQADDSQTITTNPLTVNYTVSLDAQTNEFKFRTSAPMTNVRVTVSYATGTQEVIKYLPSKAAVLDGSGGYSFTSGDNTVSFPDSPFRQFNGDQVTVLVEADNMALLGNGSDFPYLVGAVQRGEFRNIPWTQDVDAKEDALGNPVSDGQILSSTTAGTRSWIDAPSGGGGDITVQDEGTPLATAATTLNFTGAGVTASGTGSTKTINIPGGAVGSVAAADVTVDDSGFTSVDADNAQEGFSELDRLFQIVAGSMPGTPGSRFQGPFVPFTSSVNVDTAGVSLYAGNTALYARSDNARVNFILPTDAEITASGVATDAQVEISVLNQAGTGRFDTGFAPTNTVVIDVEGANNIRRNTPTGTLLNFIEAHQNDLVTLTQSARGQPWVAVRVTLSNAALLLPSGLFRLQVGTRVSLNPALGFIVGIPAGVTPQAGDAYEVSVGNDDFGGYGVQSGDVIVALQDNPSRVISSTNTDWMLIRNATNDIVSLSEIRFLNTVTETDAFEDDRLMDRSDVTNVRVFLANGVLDHAPFITPSTDTDNPQASNGARYVGGDEDVGASNDFELTDFTKLGEPAGSTRAPNLLVYFDIDGSFDIANELDQVFVVLKTGQGEEVSRFNAATQFRGVTLTGSGDTYYVLDLVGASDNYSTINYLAGYTIEVVYRRTLRSFTLTDNVNAVAAIPDGSLQIGKLDATTQALITSDHSLTDEQETILGGFETGGQATTWTAGDLFVRDTDASISSEAGHYVNVGQQNGILSNHDHTRNVTFVVPKFVTVNGLQRTDNNAIKLSVTRIGSLTIQDSTQNPPATFSGQGFTAVIPASTFDVNNPIGDTWEVDGTASNLELTGAQSSFKVDRDNLSNALASWIEGLVPSDPTPVHLPENVSQLSTHLTVTEETASGWTSVSPHPIRADIARQFAALWDENRRTFTGNYFQDIADVEVIGFQGNNIFYYNSPTDTNNRTFPGAQSYILHSNVRVRNTSGGSLPINNLPEKIISFDYALDFAALGSGDNFDMLRVGPSASTPVIGLAEEEGLYLNIGRGDGGQRSRTYNVDLQVIGGHWHDRVDEVTAAEAEVIIPSDLSGSLDISIEIQLDDNGTDQGTHLETITIANLDADETLSQRTFSFPGFPSVTLDFVYDSVNNDISVPRRVLFLRPTQPFTNAALTYNVRAVRHVTETWNVSTTYARQPINAGNAHDDYGLFDPHLWQTEQLNTRNRVILAFGPYRFGDTDVDPEMAVTVVVDGQVENNGDPIRLHRPMSDFTFDDMNFGNSRVAISHIQVYDYDGPTPNGQELLRLYNAQDRWLGAFYPPGHTVDDFVIDANWELTDGHGLILRSPNGDRHFISVDNTGALETNKL